MAADIQTIPALCSNSIEPVTAAGSRLLRNGVFRMLLGNDPKSIEMRCPLGTMIRSFPCDFDRHSPWNRILSRGRWKKDRVVPVS